jgi:hypothetical protein
MSALGHKPTFALQQGVSALSPTATAKADIGSNPSRLLYPENGPIQCTSEYPLRGSGHAQRSYAR